MSKYGPPGRDTPVRLLQRRDTERQPGMVWQTDGDFDKAEAGHRDDGDVDRVGRDRRQQQFVYLHKLADRLQSPGNFDVARMRHV